MAVMRRNPSCGIRCFLFATFLWLKRFDRAVYLDAITARHSSLTKILAQCNTLIKLHIQAGEQQCINLMLYEIAVFL